MATVHRQNTSKTDNRIVYTSPSSSVVKNPLANAGDTALIPGLGSSPGGGNGNPTSVILPGKSHAERSLMGYSPWGHKESDMTEHSVHMNPTSNSHVPAQDTFSQSNTKNANTTVYLHLYLEKEMATHSSILAWKIPWMEELGRLQFMGMQRVGHD